MSVNLCLGLSCHSVKPGEQVDGGGGEDERARAQYWRYWVLMGQAEGACKEAADVMLMRPIRCDLDQRVGWLLQRRSINQSTAARPGLIGGFCEP